MPRWGVVLCLLASLLATPLVSTSVAYADGDDDEAAEEPPPLPPRREVPDLDGRPEVHDDALEAARQACEGVQFVVIDRNLSERESVSEALKWLAEFVEEQRDRSGS